MMAATGQALTATCCSRRCGADMGTAESITPSAKAGDIASTENPVEAAVLVSSLQMSQMPLELLQQRTCTYAELLPVQR
jgi:hypothetical protein